MHVVADVHEALELAVCNTYAVGGRGEDLSLNALAGSLLGYVAVRLQFVLGQGVHTQGSVDCVGHVWPQTEQGEQVVGYVLLLAVGVFFIQDAAREFNAKTQGKFQ